MADARQDTLEREGPQPTVDGVLLTLRRDTTLERDGHGLALFEGHIRMRLRPPAAATTSAPSGPAGPADGGGPGDGGGPVDATDWMGAVLDVLAAGAVDEDQLFTLAMERAGDTGALSLQLLLRRLEVGGWLERVVVCAGVEVARMVPLGHVIEPSTRGLRPTDRVQLSRFAVLRRDHRGLLVESPRGSTQVLLDTVVGPAVVAACARPQVVGDLADLVTGLTGAGARGLAQALFDAAVLDRLDPAPGPGASDTDDTVESAALALWSLPDLLFHTRSRIGRHEGGYGGTYPWEGRAEPLPALRAPFAPTRPLPPVDLGRAGALDPPFGDVVRARRSTRSHDDEAPITVEQLAELLARVAAVRSVFHDGHQELSDRQVPSGGALHELELYPLVSRCVGLDPGLYHYEAGAHALGLVKEPGPSTTLLTQYAMRTATMETPPQVVLLVTARFGRAMWKYESMAYALVLKHVGVLYEATYLTATAMGLAVCGLGGGNSDAFAAASGIDAHEESTVGELVVGSRPATLAPDAWRAGA